MTRQHVDFTGHYDTSVALADSTIRVYARFCWKRALACGLQCTRFVRRKVGCQIPNLGAEHMDPSKRTPDQDKLDLLDMMEFEASLSGETVDVDMYYDQCPSVTYDIGLSLSQELGI